MAPDSPFAAARAERERPDRLLPGWIEAILPPAPQAVRILDVNSGPLPALGNVSPQREVELVLTDSLAHAFREAAGGEAGPLQLCPEDALAAFGAGSFDLVYSFNGIAFTEDPVAVYRQLLACLKPWGRVITFHETTPDPDRIEREWYRFFHGLRGDRVILIQRGYRLDLQDALPEATVAWSMENGFLRLELRPREDPLTVTLPPALAAGSEPPLLISLHLPKTAGSSFRRFLDDLYGDTLRALYAEHETAPHLVGSVDLAADLRCLHGHFQADAFLDRLPGARLVTWMRHPVERVVSSYFQFLRHPKSVAESDFNRRFFENGWSLMEFARLPEIRRQIRWYLNAVPLESFFFIGLTERYADSIRLFCHLLGQPGPAALETVNLNPEKAPGERYALPAAQRSELEGLYAEELVLYRHVEARFEEQSRQAFS